MLVASLILQNGYVHGASLKGRVIDSETNEPLFGVTVICREVALAFSDDKGYFTLQLDNMNPLDTVLFRHISYHELLVPLSRLNLDLTVRMECRFISLSEVTVTPTNFKKLVQSIVAQFKKSAPAQPYWTKIHQTHSLTYRGELAGYVEYTGHMLCMGRAIANPFVENKWFPEHVRRIKENPNVPLIFGDEYRIRFSENSIQSLWVEYRFFDVIHPLGKNHNCYEVRVDSAVTMDGKDYWALSYRQNAPLVVAGWLLSNSSGQMWIEKNSKKLVRLKGSCNQGDTRVTQADIDYGTFEGKVVPRKMYVSVINNRNLRGVRAQDKVLYESRILFTEADSKQVKKYKNDYMGVICELLFAEAPFEPEYWIRFPVFGNMNFSEGAQQPIYRNPDEPPIQELKLSTETGLQQMKKEIESLTWKTIQPNQ